MAKLNTKIVMLKGEQGKDGTTIKSVEKTASSGFVDTYTITLTDGSKFSYNITNGKDGTTIKSVEKTASSGLTDTYTITLTDGSTSTFEVTNGKDGELTNLDDTLSTTSTNPIQNQAVANEINNLKKSVDATLSTTSTNPIQNQAVANEINNLKKSVDATLSTTSTNPIQNKAVAAAINTLNTNVNSLSTNVNSLSKFPKFYRKFIRTEIEVTLEGPMPTELASSEENFEKGLYIITYDVYLSTSSKTGDICASSIGLASDANCENSYWHTLNGNLGSYTTVSYTDFIELSEPGKVKIMARTISGENTLRVDAYPTILKLR